MSRLLASDPCRTKRRRTSFVTASFLPATPPLKAIHALPAPGKETKPC